MRSELRSICALFGVRHVHAIDAILASMIEPILNPVWVYLFVGEKMGDWVFIGGSMVLLGSIGRALIKQKIEVKK